MPLFDALLLSVAVALIAGGLHALTPSGVIAATAVGTAVLAGTGWPGLAALGAFFAGSTLISRLAPDRTVDFGAKGGRRDALQVLANGGAAAVGALIPEAGPWIVTGSLAAAAADTWATSVGGWSRTWPRDLLSRRPVPPGTSGGVTWLGSAGALAGAASVGGASVLAGGSATLFSTALGVGMLSMLADSALGSVVQGRFHCDACGQATERRVHRCGRPARPTGGSSWLTNDGVNALAAALGALAAWAAWWSLG